MSDLTKKHSEQQLHTNTDAEEKNTINKGYSEEQPKFKHTWENIKGTPFFMIGDQEKGYMAVMGKSQITQRFTTTEELEEYVYTQPWELLITIMVTIIDAMKEMKNREDSILTENKIEDILEKEMGNMPEGWLKKNGLE